MAPFSDRLLAWWERHGRHDLPWQHPRTPYRVWVSEIMLQQTQVATVIPYFERWMGRFPNLPSLAAAEPDDVLAHWSGLGYYARARNLHRAAEICMAEHGGHLPASAEGLTALPGIGASTANAIISQAHDTPLPILDGNVRRVLARHAAVEGWPGQRAVHHKLWAEAESRLPAGRGADYTQAIMDLGATVCVRAGPACDDCPVSGDCLALARQQVDRLPSPRPGPKVRERDLFMLIQQRDDGAVLLVRRPPAGIWGGLWSLPDADSLEALADRFGLDARSLSTLPSFGHRLTHRKLTIHPACCPPGARSGVEDGHARWCKREEWRALGMPRPVLRLLESLPEVQG